MSEIKYITVFTPTYNRAYCLFQLYESLTNQSNQNFIWMIIDDGSTDNTKELVHSWTEENKIEVQYFYKDNGGMHSAHNEAYKNITTAFNVCIDSDDKMPTNAIDLILSKIKVLQPHHAGIIGLDANLNGKIIGSKIPSDISETTVAELYQKYKVTGDKKLVIKTEIVKQFPKYPVYKGEKLVPLGTLYLQIDQKYKWLCSNEVYCIVEYLPDGSSGTILKQYKKSPRGFAYNRIIKMQYATSFVEKFKNAIHFVSSALFAKDIKMLFSNPFLLYKLFAIPFGVVLNMYIRFKIKFSK
jgi:glycosyltransferase involved in cell wall biosynthesis